MPLELLRPGLAIVLAFFSSSTDGSCCLESSSTVGGLQWELWGGGQHHSNRMFLLQPFSPESLKHKMGWGGGYPIFPETPL